MKPGCARDFRQVFFRLRSLTLLLSCMTLVYGQVPSIHSILDEGASDLLRTVPDLQVLVESPPLGTDIGDAVSGFAALDGFEPLEARSLSSLPRGSNGGFLISTGVYEGDLESFCLKAGTYGPGDGDGYLMAPYRGPNADMICNVLKRATDHPEIKQRDIQVLLWAIIARSNVRNLSREVQWTAAQLLTPREIYRLSGGALGLIPEDVLPRVVRKMSLEARTVFQAEEDIRRLLAGGESRLGPLERLAVLQGRPPWGRGSRKVPSGRWSYHTDGYFVSYLPKGYSETRLRILYPGLFSLERDALGRIATLKSPSGTLLNFGYAENGSAGLGRNAFELRSVRLHGQQGVGEEFVDMGDRSIWTWVSKGGRTGPSEKISGRVAERRLEKFRLTEGELEDFLSGGTWTASGLDRLEDLKDLVHLRDAVVDASKGWSAAGRARDESVDLLHRGVASLAVQLLRGTEMARDLREIEYDPSSQLAVPGNTARQRLGLSARLR